jgi:hypothetical protein
MDVRLDEVVLHALEKEPARRYQQASQVKTAVETIASGAAAPAQAAPAPPGHFPKRKELVLALAGSALALCLGCFGMFLAIEGESVLVVVVMVLFSFLLLLLVSAWDEFLKKTSVETIASGTAAAAPLLQAPRSDRFWRRMTVAIGVLCLVLILILIVFRFAPVLHRTNQREADDKPSWWDDVPAETKAYVAAQKALATVPPRLVPDGVTEKEDARLVIDSEFRTGQDHQALIWHSRCLVPADHQAQIVFVLWSNGVPAIHPELSGYLKATQKPVLLENMLWSCRTNTVGPDGATNTAQWAANLGWAYTTSGWISNQPPYRRVEPSPRSVLHSGRQLAIRLAEFVPAAGSSNNGWSGVELRLFLQPLVPPAVRTDPNEFEGTNFVAGFGLDGASEDTILEMIKELPLEAPVVESSFPGTKSEPRIRF